jgi:hypothetical protein
MLCKRCQKNQIAMKGGQQMNVKMRHFLRTTSVLLVLAVLLLGQTPPATALEAHQELPGRVVQGYGDFPRLPVVAPGADSTTLTLYLVEGDRATQLLEFEAAHWRRFGHRAAFSRWQVHRSLVAR